jgi:hypothetical protein
MRGVMSERTGLSWGLRPRRDRPRLEQHRKADGVFKLDGVKAGKRGQGRQIEHAFLFGGNIFQFGDHKA